MQQFSSCRKRLIIYREKHVTARSQNRLGNSWCVAAFGLFGVVIISLQSSTWPLLFPILLLNVAFSMWCRTKQWLPMCMGVADGKKIVSIPFIVWLLQLLALILSWIHNNKIVTINSTKEIFFCGERNSMVVSMIMFSYLYLCETERVLCNFLNT